MRLLTTSCIGTLIAITTASFNFAIAAPFDKTGLIDRKNEATTRASCTQIGELLKISTNKLTVAVLQRRPKTQDEAWAYQKTVDQYEALGKAGERFAEALNDSMGQNLPPSQVAEYSNHYRTNRSNLMSLADSKPQLFISAFKNCWSLYRRTN